jgi:hypothetical protein
MKRVSSVRAGMASNLRVRRRVWRLRVDPTCP